MSISSTESTQTRGLTPSEDVVMEDAENLGPEPDTGIPEDLVDSDSNSNADSNSDHLEEAGNDGDEVPLSDHDDSSYATDDDEPSHDDTPLADTEPVVLVHGPSMSPNPQVFPSPDQGQRRVSQNLTEPLERSEDLYTEHHPSAGKVYGSRDMSFDAEIHSQHERGGGNIYYPFANDVDFELGAWLSDSGLSRSKIDAFLALKYVQQRMPSFSSARMLRDRIKLLPDGGPRWKQRTIVPEYGNSTTPVTLFYKNTMDVVAHLLSRPSLAPHLDFAPRKLWTDQSKQSRVYSEMATGDWWWDVQNDLRPGSTVIPLVIGSDKTNLTNHSGDKKAWPVYLSIGNINIKARRTRSMNAWVVIGFIPVIAWNNPEEIRGTLTSRLFHQCSKIIFESIIEPGNNGALLPDSVGDVRNCFPRLAAWLSDNPEQLMLNCAAGNTCPTTTAGSKDLGDAHPFPPRTTEWILHQIEQAVDETDPNDITSYMLNGVHDPFWRYLPGYCAELCVAPDLFHGVICLWRDHLFKWIVRLVGRREIDNRLKALQRVSGFCHFSKGVTQLSQWTGREDKELQRVTVALIAGAPNVTPKSMRCIRAFHDFLYVVQYRSHSDKTIGFLRDYLAIFHANKNAFIETGVRRGKKKGSLMEHFNIPKLAALHTYEWHIPQLGSPTQFSSELTEVNHQPFVKDPFNKSSKHNYGGQICRDLDRKLRISHAREFHLWVIKKAEEQRMAKALSTLSPKFQHRVKVDLFPPLNPELLLGLQKSRRNVRLWLSTRPKQEHWSLREIANAYSLPYLLVDLDRYLRDAELPPAQRAENGIADVLYADVWEKLSIRTPDIQNDAEFSHTHTVDAIPPDKEKYPFGHGYRLAQARLFIKVYLPPSTTVPLPLAWNISTLQQDPRLKKTRGQEPRTVHLAYMAFFNIQDDVEEDILMYRVSRENRGSDHRKGSFVPLESITRFVQLIPRFDGRADPQIVAENSMEICQNYYLNSFATHQIFQSVY